MSPGIAQRSVKYQRRALSVSLATPPSRVSDGSPDSGINVSDHEDGRTDVDHGNGRNERDQDKGRRSVPRQNIRDVLANSNLQPSYRGSRESAMREDESTSQKRSNSTPAHSQFCNFL